MVNIQGDIMTKIWYLSKTMWVNAIGIVAIITQGQFGFVIDPSTQLAMLAVLNMFLRAVTGENIAWENQDDE